MVLKNGDGFMRQMKENETLSQRNFSPSFSFLFQNDSLDSPNFNCVEIDWYWDSPSFSFLFQNDSLDSPIPPSWRRDDKYWDSPEIPRRAVASFSTNPTFQVSFNSKKVVLTAPISTSLKLSGIGTAASACLPDRQGSIVFGEHKFSKGARKP